MTAEQTLKSAEAQVLGVKIDGVGGDVVEIKKTLEKLTDVLQVVTELRVQQNHTSDAIGRAFNKLDKHEARLVPIENAMPALKEARRWVVGGVLAGVSMMGVALLKMVVIDPMQQPRIVYVAPPAPQQQAGPTINVK